VPTPTASKPASPARTYKKVGATSRLTRIADPNGNALDITFNPPGNVASMTDGSANAARTFTPARCQLLHYLVFSVECLYHVTASEVCLRLVVAECRLSPCKAS
jgi:hypothetical protein